MCFFTSVGIDGPTVNGLVLPVEAFIVSFDHFFLILFLQREANYKCDNTDPLIYVVPPYPNHYTSNCGLHPFRFIFSLILDLNYFRFGFRFIFSLILGLNYFRF
jgi:hypothetical protein